jgi:GxxExxY protein
MKLESLTETIICCFYTVYNTLGYGFLEKVYENALCMELEKKGLRAQCQHPITVFYNGSVVGEYFADILVEGEVILEIKAAACIIPGHEAQLLNYLKATGKEVGLILNFGPSPEIKRRML